MASTSPPKPLILVPFATARPRTFNTLLCDGIAAHNLASFADLRMLHARLQHEHPHVRVLATLEDLDQACYTAGHGTDRFGLDSTDGHDLSDLDADAFEDGAHRGYLSTPSEFPIRLANLRHLAGPVTLASLSGQLDWDTPDGPYDILTLNADPDQALLLATEPQVLFQFVPVTQAADALAAFPNGYFTVDFSPLQNHALAHHLEVRYGLALFGIGARTLAFHRPTPLDAPTAHQLVTDLASLYTGSTPAKTKALAELLTNRDWLLLRYTEG
jgi:hypothetical protein